MTPFFRNINDLSKKSKTRPIIGILGGMSSYSTARFYKELIRISHKSYNIKRNENLPKILIYDISPPIFPDIDTTVDMIIKGIKKLEESGCELLTIPCNTTHIILDRIKEIIDIPIISIVDASVNEISINKVKEVLVLGTFATVNARLYQVPLEKHNIKASIPNSKDQKKLDSVLKKITYGTFGKKERKYLNKLLLKFRGRAVLLACTELSLVVDPEKYEFDIFDSLSILAKTTLEKYYNSYPIKK